MTEAFKQGFMNKMAQMLIDPAIMAALRDIAEHGTPAVNAGVPPAASTNAPAATAVAASKPKAPKEPEIKPEHIKLEEKPSVIENLFGEGPNPNFANASIPFLQNLDMIRSADDVKNVAKNFVKNPSFSWTWRF